MIPERYVPQVYALFRIVTAFLFMFHGLQKFGLLEDPARPLASVAGAAAIIEAFGGLLIMIGLFTRPVAFIASGEMAVAYFWRHQPKGTWPIENGGELAALYCFAFLYIAARGAGIWSIDAMRGLRVRK
jgi:putative oxidoreductase